MVHPIINNFKWGVIEIDGICYVDAKIYPDRAENWNWGKTNTDHDTGIQAQDVQDLVDYGCTFIILSQGLARKLDIAFEAYKVLLKADIDFLVTDTISAINRYKEEINEEIHLVGALIHTKD